jgi:hypothetical protein
LTFSSGRFRSAQSIAVRSRKALSSSVVVGTTIFDRSIDSSNFTARRVAEEEEEEAVVVLWDVNADVDDDARRTRMRIGAVFSRIMMPIASARSQRVLLCTYYIMFDRVVRARRGEARRGEARRGEARPSR